MKFVSGSIVALTQVFLLVIVVPDSGLGQTTGRNTEKTPRELKKGPVILKRAQDIRVNRATSRVVATGDVALRYGSNHLRADTVYYNRDARTLEAFGSVWMRSPTQGIQTARYAKIDLRTNEIRTRDLRGKNDPWYISSPHTAGDADTEIQMKDASFTTCNLRTPHYDIEAEQLYIYPGEEIVAWHATVNVASVPIFYFPYYTIDLRNKKQRLEIRPGHSDKSGLKLAVNYHYLLPSDTGPWTTTIYTDFREKDGPGGGFDLGYDSPNGGFDFFTFMANRRPATLDQAGNEVIADTEQTLWRVTSDANYDFPGTNWSFQSDVEWIQNDRFRDDFETSLGGRSVDERKYDASLVHTGEQSIFRVDVEREEDPVARNVDEESFELKRKILPRVEYQLFSTPVDFLGEGIFYRADVLFENIKDGPGEESLWSGSVSQTLTRSIALTSSWGQTFNIGYEQRLDEKETGSGSDSRSLGLGLFGVSNSFRVTSLSTLDVNYNLERRLNREDSAPISLQGQNLGFEENGFRTHLIGLDYQWYASRFSGSLRTGYDLRQAEKSTIESDSRIVSPQLNFDYQLTPRLKWQQFLLYSVTETELEQSSSQFEFDWNQRLNFSVGANYSRREGSEDDFLKFVNGFHWESSNNQWELRGDITYDEPESELEEFQLMVRKRLHKWDFRVFLSTIRDRETKIFFTFNLIDYPSHALGFSANVAEEGFDFERGQASEYGP